MLRACMVPRVRADACVDMHVCRPPEGLHEASCSFCLARARASLPPPAGPARPVRRMATWARPMAPCADTAGRAMGPSRPHLPAPGCSALQEPAADVASLQARLTTVVACNPGHACPDVGTATLLIATKKANTCRCHETKTRTIKCAIETRSKRTAVTSAHAERDE